MRSSPCSRELHEHARAGKTAHRRNEDHGSAVLDEHLAEFLRREVGVTQAEIKLAVPKLVGDLKDVGPRRDANDVDEAVKRSELLPSERREPNHLGTFRSVARPCNANADFLSNFICTRTIDVDRDHLGSASLSKCVGNLSSDALSSPQNNVVSTVEAQSCEIVGDLRVVCGGHLRSLFVFCFRRLAVSSVKLQGSHNVV